MDWKEVLQGGMGSAIGSGMGLISGAINTNQQKKSQERAYRLNEQAADNAQRRALEMWEATNFSAQRAQMEKAGLNPGLMMSQGGMQPSTQGAQGSAPGGGSGDYSANPGMGLMLGQLELIKAQTNKTNAEAENLRGADRSKTEAQTKSLLQGVENARAEKVLTELLSTNQELDNKIKNDSIEEATNYIKGLQKYQSQQIENLGYQNQIDRETVNSKIGILNAELSGTLVRNELMKAQILKTGQEINESKAKINQMIETIAQGWKSLDIDTQKAKIEQFKADLQASYPGLLNVGGGLIDRIGRGLSEILGTDHDKFTKKNN